MLANFKVQKFCFEEILYFWLERRRWFFPKRFSAKVHKYILVLSKHTEWCSAKLQKRVLETTERCHSKIKMLSRKCSEVFCKTTETCSAKLLKGVVRTCCEVFCKTTEKTSAKVLEGVLENYWYMVCRNTQKCSAKILGGALQKYW